VKNLKTWSIQFSKGVQNYGSFVGTGGRKLVLPIDFSIREMGCLVLIAKLIQLRHGGGERNGRKEAISKSLALK
jgi:hypothetical protein